MARRIGYTEEQIAALAHHQETDLFEPPIKAALLYAEEMTRDAHNLTDEVFARMKEHYSDKQILELTCVVSLTNYFNRLTSALRIDLSGSNRPYGSAN